MDMPRPRPHCPRVRHHCHLLLEDAPPAKAKGHVLLLGCVPGPAVRPCCSDFLCEFGGIFWLIRSFSDIFFFQTWGFAYFSFQLYIGTYGSVVGLGSFAPYLLIINNGCSTFGRLLAGYLADKIGGYNSMISGTAVLAIMLWCWLAIKSLGGCIALVIIAGIASGSFLGLQAPVAMYTAKDQRLGGTMFGQAVCFQSFGILACGPAVGAVLGVATETTFMHAKIFIAVFMTAAIAALVAGRLVAQPKLLGKV
jgi:MFS family permease